MSQRRYISVLVLKLRRTFDPKVRTSGSSSGVKNWAAGLSRSPARNFGIRDDLFALSASLCKTQFADNFACSFSGFLQSKTGRLIKNIVIFKSSVFAFQGHFQLDARFRRRRVHPGSSFVGDVCPHAVPGPRQNADHPRELRLRRDPEGGCFGEGGRPMKSRHVKETQRNSLNNQNMYAPSARRGLCLKGSVVNAFV